VILKSNGGQLVELSAQLLKGFTDAGERVLIARSWPTKAGALPDLIVDPLYREKKQSLGKNAPQFDTEVVITVRGRVSSPAGVDDAGSFKCGEAIETIKRQIERRLINAYPMMLKIEQFTTIETAFVINTENALAIGEVQMTIGMGIYEGTEDFAATEADMLAEVAIYPDLTNVADPTGTYSQHPFPNSVVPAPRTTGPDGRVEGGGLVIDTDPDS